ncbi:MAG TPA: septum formation initiator [Campylobacterales bacterium]|nr:septum formation initiator [Campylobacterales bacterium]
MREVLDDLLSLENRKNIIVFVAKFLAAFFLIVAVGVYIGNILFGKDSLEVLIDIQNKEMSLRQEVQRLKEENEKLQKEYFELKELEPK